MTATQCLDVLVHADKQRSRWEAVKARALARFADLRRAGDGLEEGAPEEVAVELGMNPHTAAAQIAQAHDLAAAADGSRLSRSRDAASGYYGGVGGR